MTLLKAELNLDELWTGAEWQESVAGMIKDELKFAIRDAMRKALKEDKDLQKVIKEYKKRALKEALQNIGMNP
jgi:hypothetical protein